MTKLISKLKAFFKSLTADSFLADLEKETERKL